MGNISPPKFPFKLLQFFCKPSYLVDIEGDILEIYERRLKKFGQKKANRLLYKDVILLFRPGIIRSLDTLPSIIPNLMLLQNLKFATRQLLKHGRDTFINILGLALGVACFLLISLFVWDELSYDTYNENASQIARIVLKAKLGDEIIEEAATPAPVSPSLAFEFPEVKQATRIHSVGGPTKIKYKDQSIREGTMVYVDSNFFQVFTLPMLQGDPITALKQPNSIVLTERMASVYFGDEEALNKDIEIEGRGLFKVKGIIEEVPTNSHFHFDLFASMSGLELAKNQNWLTSQFTSYVLLSKATNFEKFEAKLPAFVDKYMGGQLKEAMGISMDDFRAQGNRIGLFVQPLLDIHLKSDFSAASEFEPGGDIQAVYIFAAIAIFVLLIACINFINLSTAAASKRAKEISMRKVLGSNKSQLVIQFLTESFLANFIALLLGMLIIIFTLPYFNELANKSFELSQIFNLQTLGLLLALMFGLSILVGIYPALLLSTFRIIENVRSRYMAKGTQNFRGGLVVFQFIISVVLIVGTIIVGQQMAYIQNKDIGYDRDKLVVLLNAGILGDKLNAYKEKLLQNPLITQVSNSRYVPAGPTNNSMSPIYYGTNRDAMRRTSIYNVDENYIPVMGMEIVKGRNFSPEYGEEGSNVIINETTAKIFGLGDNPVGKQLVERYLQGEADRRYTVIGVVKDFHFRSLHEAIQPLMIRYNPTPGLIIKHHSDNLPKLLSTMKSEWEGLKSDEVFEYAFLDKLYNETYETEQKTGNILMIFASMAIFIACMGLFALVTFATELRFKEIGIRKVLGSSVGQIVALLSSSFLKWVLISFVIAFPLSYYLMSRWLESFAYRTEIGTWIFLLAAVITLLIAGLTISYKSVRVALMNPVKAISTE